MEKPFASLVDAAEERVAEHLELLDLPDTPENRYTVADHLYKMVKGNGGGVGDDRPFMETMYLIALSSLQMQYSRERILQHLDS